PPPLPNPTTRNVFFLQLLFRSSCLICHLFILNMSSLKSDISVFIQSSAIHILEIHLFWQFIFFAYIYISCNRHSYCWQYMTVASILYTVTGNSIERNFVDGKLIG
ncbi:unnamed protein product, partial [Lymnaea stagnalis]